MFMFAQNRVNLISDITDGLWTKSLSRLSSVPATTGTEAEVPAGDTDDAGHPHVTNPDTTGTDTEVEIPDTGAPDGTTGTDGDTNRTTEFASPGYGPDEWAYLHLDHPGRMDGMYLCPDRR